MDPAHYTCASHSDPLYFGGVELRDLHEFGIGLHDMQPYLPLTQDQVENKGPEVHFMSFYTHWSPQQSYYYSKENSAFESNPDGRSRARTANIRASMIRLMVNTTSHH